MVRGKLPFPFPLLLVLAMATGCAPHKAYVVARRDPQYSPSPMNKIALVNQLKPRPEELALSVTLTAELEQQGFHLVAAEEADYTLAYWIERNWQLRTRPVRTLDPNYVQTAAPIGPLSPREAVLYPYSLDESLRSPVSWVEDPVAVQGIRLQLYSRPSAGAGRPQTAWEGYIDGGFKVSPEREPVLLKTLLSFFGKDYAGRTKLIE